MKDKLTLTIDSEIIKKAKCYACSRGISLLELVENYLKELTANGPTKGSEELPPIVKSLKGAFKATKNFDYKKILKSRRASPKLVE